MELNRSPVGVFEKLEALRKWQEEQQKILEENQNIQKQLLFEEQQKLYEMLGLDSQDEDNASPTEEPDLILERIQQFEEDVSVNLTGDVEIVTQPSIEPHQETHKHRSLDKVNAKHPKKTERKPFLKRGEGLKNRFKISPDAFNLKKLPKYKYANVHKKLKLRPSAQQVSTASTEHKLINSDTRTQIDCKTNNPTATPEKRVLNSVDGKLAEILERETASDISGSNHLDINDCEDANVAWAKVLDVNNANNWNNNSLSSLMPTISKQFDNTQMFEFLEKHLNDSNFSSNVSRILDALGKMNLEQGPDTKQSLPDHDSESKSIIISQTIDKCLDTQTFTESSDSDIDDKKQVRFSDSINYNESNKAMLKKNDIEDGWETDAEQDERSLGIQTSTPLVPPEIPLKLESQNVDRIYQMIKMKCEPLRFNDSQSSCRTIVQNATERDNYRKLMDNESSRNVDIQLANTIEQLEKEIDNFQRENKNLIRLRQKFELEKIEFLNEIATTKEKLENERIRIEINLHDERMKLAEDRSKLERKLKEAKQPVRKEREELSKLREQNEHLQQELKNKEQKHVAAQSRLRSQMKSMEKDLKEYSTEIGVLKGEIKRLELENSQLKRESNAKLLKEINKNIAKLTPPADAGTGVVEALKIKRGILNKPKQCNKNIKGRIVPRAVGRNNAIEQIRHRSRSVPNLQEEQPPNNITCMIESISSDETPVQPSNSIYSPSDVEHEYRKPPEKEDEAIISKDVDVCNKSGQREIENIDGSKDVWYPNGNLKKISPDGMIIKMYYFNKDIKESNIMEGTIKYYYAETDTWHTTYIDGLEILEYPK